MSRNVKSGSANTLVAASLFALAVWHPVAAATPKIANERQIVETFIAAVSRPDKTPNAKSAFGEVAQNMDFEEMAKRSFGDAGWAKFAPDEQKEVTALFKRLVEIRFYPRWRRVFQNGHFEVSSQSRDGNDSLVLGALQMDGKKSELTFRLSKSREGFRLVSMKVKDKDLLERTSTRMKRGLKRKGAAGLIAYLRKKTEEAPRDVSDKQLPEELISGGK